MKNKSFFFGDYQGTRSNVGGSRLLTVPTAAARNGDLSAYGVNIYDPAGGRPRRAGRSSRATSSRPAGSRRRPCAILSLIPLPNAAGTDNGTRDNYRGVGHREVQRRHLRRAARRAPQRPREHLRRATASRKFDRNGPTAFGQGGGLELVSLGGVSEVQNQSLAAGVDFTLSPTTVLDFRFGFFKYKVDVLPFDFGTTPAADAGIPGLNLDNTFTSGLPASSSTAARRRCEFGSGLDVDRCNCPLDQNEKQFQVVCNLTKIVGNHTLKFGVDIRRAYNLRVPSDSHRSGQLYFNENGTRGPSGGGLGLATFLLGDVQSLRSLRQPEHRRARAPVAPVLLRAGHLARHLEADAELRPAARHHQPADRERRRATAAGSTSRTGEIRVGGVGDVDLHGNVKNKLNWAPRLGATYQINDKTVIRAGYGRSYDIGVFGSLFGHTVTQNLPVLSVQS